MSEERIRRAIRERLRDQYGVAAGEDLEEEVAARPFKPYGTEQDVKLEREMPKNAEMKIVEEEVKERRDEAV